MRKIIPAVVASGGGAQAFAVDGWDTADYIGTASTSLFDPVATYGTGLWIRHDANPTTTTRIATKGAGSGGGWSWAMTSLPRIQFTDDGLATLQYGFTAEDVGRDFLFWAQRSTGGRGELWMYRVGDRTAQLIDEDTSVTAPTTTTEVFRLGQRGTGANVYTDGGIVGFAYGTTFLTETQIRDWFRACVASRGMSTSLPGGVSAYSANTDHPDHLARDIIGTNHLTVTESVAGNLDPVGHSPNFRNESVRVFFIAGQSNAAGQDTQANLNAYDTAQSTTYASAYAPVQLWNEVDSDNAWADTDDAGDNLYGAELSLARQLIAGGEVSGDAFVYKDAAGGSDLATDWAASGPGADLALFEAGWAEASGIARGWHPCSVPLLAGVLWVQGEADAQVSGSASAYQANLEALIDRFRSRYPLAPDFVWVEALLPAFQSYTFKSTVNAAKAAVATLRSYVVTIDTDALTDVGDSVHYAAESLIELGISAEEAIRTAANVTASAPP